MFFKHIYDTDLAQGSYLIGCQATGEAVVVDARRDIETFIDIAEAEGLRITTVTETHIHADYLSGSRELAEKTGATLLLSAEGGPGWEYGFAHTPLKHNDTITVGNIRIQALHTPGHTPEHLSFLVTDLPRGNEPTMILTGDFVFVGDLGRPDLLDEAAGYTDTRFVGAKQLFQSLQKVFLTLPDYVQVWPGHGAGSACGKALGAVASTTVGYERSTSWWASFLKNNDLDGFVEELLAGQPDAPLYFGRMKRENRDGPAMRPTAALTQYTSGELAGRINRDIVLFDTRVIAEQREDPIAGALSVPHAGSFVTYASYVINPDHDSRDIIVVAENEEEAQEMRTKLWWVGIDNVAGFTTDLTELPRGNAPIITPHELGPKPSGWLLDVRTKSEFAAGHIAGSHQVHLGQVLYKLDELPREKQLVVYCQGGGRSAVVLSVLRAHGFANAIELEGSFNAWSALFPQEVAR